MVHGRAWHKVCMSTSLLCQRSLRTWRGGPESCCNQHSHSFPGKCHEIFPYYNRKIVPSSNWGSGGCGTHSIVRRAGGELENPSPVGQPGPALAISVALTDTDQAQHHLLVPVPGTHSHHTWAHTLISTRSLSWAACPGIASPPA